MGRMARFSAPNNFYHVTQRGNYRQVVFESDEDKEVYMGYFQNYALEFGMKLYAWCLMSNHVHFIVKPLKREIRREAYNGTHCPPNRKITNHLANDNIKRNEN
jgi:putative transposase